jgi:hypothetical protein
MPFGKGFFPRRKIRVIQNCKINNLQSLPSSQFRNSHPKFFNRPPTDDWSELTWRKACELRPKFMVRARTAKAR